jgi:DNA methyltransferase 1-associated protein 1
MSDGIQQQQPSSSSSSNQQQVKVGTKWIRSDKPARKWAWAPFVSSSRTDGAVFYHWVRAGVEYPDYPYSRFDVHLDPVAYTDEEYRRYLSNENWTKGETDYLLDLARICELRWPVVHDRWLEQQALPRKVEDLQHRYYWVAAKLNQVRIAHEASQEVHSLVSATPTTLSAADDPAKIAATENLLIEAAAARALATSDGSAQPLMSNLGTGSTNKVFDLDAERERRAHADALWNRSKEDEGEEMEIRNELRQVEAQLRKLKKAGAHIVAAASSSTASSSSDATHHPSSSATSDVIAAMAGAAPSATSSRNPSRSGSPTTATAAASLIEASGIAADRAVASIAPVPTARNPYLQSGRLSNPIAGGGGGGSGANAGMSAAVPSSSSTVAAAAVTAAGAGINKSLLARMEAVLAELHINPAALIPTKRVCDLYDNVRRDILTLLVLQKNLFQKETMLESKRLKLAKMGGSLSGPASGASNASAGATAIAAAGTVMDEEALMGIVPPPPPAPIAPPAGQTSAGAASSTGAPNRGAGAGAGAAAAKGKGGSAGGGKQLKGATTGKNKASSVGAKSKAAATHDGTTSGAGSRKGGGGDSKEERGGGKSRKPSVKRKRKTEATNTTGSSATNVGGGPSAAAKSPALAAAPSVPGTVAGIATVGSTAGAAATMSPAPTAAASTAPSGSVGPRSDDSKQAKKRAKKSTPPS